MVLQWGTPSYIERYGDSIARNVAYAHRHAYEYHLSTESFETELHGLSKHWGKVLAIQAALEV